MTRVSTAPTRRHRPAFPSCGHLGARFSARSTPKVRISGALPHFGKVGLGLFRHHVTETGMVSSELPVIRIVSANVGPLARRGPFRSLLDGVLPLIDRILLTKSTGNLATSRSDPRSLSHLRRPFHARRSKAAVRQVQQRMSLLPEKDYPGNLGLTKLVESVRPVQWNCNDAVAILLA